MMTEEQAQEVRNSIVWKNICNEIDYRISALINELVKCDVEDLKNIQRDIRQLEVLKKLPEDVIDREAIPQ